MRHRGWPISVIGLVALASAPAWGQDTTRISVATGGGQGDSASQHPSVSADGRFIAFQAWSSNLVPADTNQAVDIFVHDRQTGETTRVSVASDGSQANHGSTRPSISGDGRFVAFQSYAGNLVPGDTNNTWDIFVHDRLTGETRRVNVSSAGMQANGYSLSPSLSGDGRFVAFHSSAQNLVVGDSNVAIDAFVHDRHTGQTFRVSVASGGVQSNNDSYDPVLSTNGRYVAFWSWASNLVPDDTNNIPDVFLHDRATGATERISVSSGEAQGNDYSGYLGRASISSDGRYVAFQSRASNLVVGDTNGAWDVFVRDREFGTTSCVSLGTSGLPGNNWSQNAAISANGRFVVFDSWASDLVPADTNACKDVLVRDRANFTTTRLSISTHDVQGNESSEYPAISADGRYVAFHSWASNIVEGDSNACPDVFLRDRAIAPCCPGNADKQPGQVDFADITAVLFNYFGIAHPNGSSVGDANCDGFINFADITSVLGNFLLVCP